MVAIDFLNGSEAYEKLWIRCQEKEVADGEARAEIERIQSRLSVASTWPGFVDIGVNRKLNQKSWEAASKVISSRFATS